MVRLKVVTLLSVLLTLTVVLPGVSISSAQGGRPFTTALTGEAEVNAAGVPNQGDPDGIGSALITLNPGLGQVCYTLEVSGIVLPAAAAHIHVGASTTTGPVVVPLAAPDANGVASGCVEADRALIKAIMQNPDNYYVNVHNSV
ncbi:MAG: CHRD domain-containing protein, partial [Chloroflexota bacterium]|nr:CHRD domain-containing protein [Chloroflexota bacterium]